MACVIKSIKIAYNYSSGTLFILEIRSTKIRIEQYEQYNNNMAYAIRFYSRLTSYGDNSNNIISNIQRIFTRRDKLLIHV